MRRNFLRRLLLWTAVAALLIAAGCSGSRHVPRGQYLLDQVDIILDDSTGSLRREEFRNYVVQQPNHRFLGRWKLQLGIYNMSGRDSTKWYNKWVRRMGEAPVIFSPTLTEAGREQVQRALVNRGYLDARVQADTFLNPRRRKARVAYTLTPGQPHRIRSIDYRFPNDTLRDLLLADSAHFVVRPGDPLDRDRLESMRTVMMEHLRNRGYYAFGKEYITFNADTTQGSLDVDLTVIVNPPYPDTPDRPSVDSHSAYAIRSIRVITRYDAMTMDPLSSASMPDTVRYRDLTILCDRHSYLRPSVIAENIFLHEGDLFRQTDVDRTYDALTRLGILKFVNIRMVPAGSLDGLAMLDAYILLVPDKSQTITLELEGTNSEGDLGVAAAATYTHRNIARGSETFNLKLRGAYESLSGNLEGLIHDRYLELSADAGINFPKFKFPFLSEAYKRRINASTLFNVTMNYQERPEYTRVIATAGWSYRWNLRRSATRHTFTPIDINYVYLPESTNDFINQIAPDNPLLRYSYEDHFIMRLGYNFYHSNKRRDTPWTRGIQPNIYTIRVNAEIAGNLLFAISSIFDHRSNFREDPYKIFGINYSQYFKAEADYVFLHRFDVRNSLAFHAGAGVIVPYGNSTMAPFEKRFYQGGANGVRGWAVRTLGPGCYPGSNSVSDFINQCGDIRLDLAVEYRAKLFWVVELGLFVDAGNIWTIRDYETQPGGLFRIKDFYKQLAASYGAGIRLDFDYFLLRFDLGMKAHNPALGAEPWPLIHPRWRRDSSFHFSIGYPF